MRTTFALAALVGLAASTPLAQQETTTLAQLNATPIADDLWLSEVDKETGKKQ